MSQTPPVDHPSDKPVVTIFEAYGAGAEAVGRAVAERLGLPYHEQAFSSAALEGSDPNEQGAVLAQVFAVMGGAYGGFGGRDVATTQRQKYELVMDNNRTVWQFADEGGVIVGRNGAVILASRENAVHVLLAGTPEERIARAAKETGISAEQAAKRQAREDDVRAQMSIQLYGWDPRLPDRYDMVLNTGRLSFDAVVDAILDAVRIRTA